MNIKPSASIRNNYNEISALCKSTGEPVYLTKNGEGDLVVMDIEAFSRREKMLKLREELLAAEEDEPRGHAVQKTVNAVLAVLSVVLFFLTQPLVWRFRFVDWWTVLFVLLCGTALAMLIWRRRSESATEEDTDEE